MGAGGQEPATQAYGESIVVEVVNLEVFVTDRNGQRVTGLKREDFQVLEDGRPAEVSNFFAEGSAAAEPGEQRLQLAIMIDNRSLGTQPRSRLLKALREEVVPRLRPQDLALVATYAGSAVEVVQGLTADKGLLLAALDRAEQSTTHGGEGMDEARRLIQEIDLAHVPDGEKPTNIDEIHARSVHDGIRVYSQQQYDKTRRLLAALTDFVDAMAGLPGRKSLLYVGGGLSLRPGEPLFRAWDRKVGELNSKMGATSLEAFHNDLTTAFSAMVQHANGNRITFYTLGITEELAGLSAAAGRTSWTPDLEKLEQTNLADSLQRLADGTGGLGAVNASDPRTVLASMNEDFQSYYSLGFVPGRAEKGQPEGKDRSLRVTVRGRSDLVVRSRTAYRERPVRERMIDRTLAALLLDPGPNPLGLELEFTGATKKADGQVEAEVLVKFPLARLVLVPGGDFHEGKVSIWVATRGTGGPATPVRGITVPIHVPNDQVLTALGQNAAYKMPLLLRAGESRIAVAVRDEIGNVESAVNVPYTPGQ
jgi:VWFA-related protein